MRIIHTISGFNSELVIKRHKSTLQKAVKFGNAPLEAIERNVPGGSFIVPAALSLIPVAGPAVAAAYEGSKNWSHTGNIGSALKAGATSYISSKIGASLGDYAGNSLNLGTVGSNLGGAANVENGIASTLGGAGVGQETANAIGGTIANKSIGSLAGQAAANSYSEDLAAPPEPMAAPGPAPFSASRQEQSALPGSLQGFGGLDVNQQATNIATQGVYGQGEGPQEASYFNNLINRRLVDESGKVGDISSIQPIEQSYLQKLGLGGYSNSKDLLEAMSKWKAA